jgi:hypothetical protein
MLENRFASEPARFEGSTFPLSSDTMAGVSELKDFTRKLVKEKRKEGAIGLREWHKQRRADRRLFRMASPFVKRVLREMANVRYGRILWLWPRYSIQTISEADSSDRGWQFYDSYTLPWNRTPGHARFMVSIYKGNLHISSRHGHGHFGACSDVSEREFRKAVKKIVPDLI